MNYQAETLGEKLNQIAMSAPKLGRRTLFSMRLYSALNLMIMAAIAALLFWWLVMNPALIWQAVGFILSFLFLMWFFVLRKIRAISALAKPQEARIHPLLANDTQGFMQDIRLETKAAIIDGSNIYHFGHNNELDAQPLGLLSNQLRAEGFRIICFFDANIFYTLCEHGAFDKDTRHSMRLLEDIFGLQGQEIYVVPSKVDADNYILRCKKHLPNAFVISNDQFRDYKRDFKEIMQGNNWRKPVQISNGELKLLQHKLRRPLLLNLEAP